MLKGVAKMQGIYCIEHIESGRKYYGSSFNIKKRLTGHKRELRNQMHHNIQLQRAVDKHGLDQFNFYVVEETHFSNRKDLLNYEQTYLDKNISGYNMAPASGGDILSNHPNKEEIREKIKSSHKKTIDQMLPEHRKLKFGKPGDTNPNFRNGGISTKICPKCESTKISVKSKVCGACRDRTGKNNAFYGKHHSPKTIKYLKEINSGDNSWIKGIDPSLLPYTKQYIIVYPDNTSKQVTGLKAIATEFNVSIENVHATIKRIAEGKIPTRGVFANISIKEIIKS